MEPAELPPSAEIEDVYETMMMELADNVVRRTEEAAKHDYATLDEAKAALDEVLPQNSLGQLDAVLGESGIDKREMATFMRDNPELVAKVGKQFEAKLATAEADLAKLVAKVEALQDPTPVPLNAQDTAPPQEEWSGSTRRRPGASPGRPDRLPPR